MKHVLITGAAGFLGHYLVREFIKDSRVSCIVRPSTNNLIRLHDVLDRIQLIEHDIKNSYQDLTPLLSDVDIILHAGGNPSAYSSLIDPISAVTDNVIGTLRILEFARSIKIKKFVYYSAGEVFGAVANTIESAETDAYNSLSPYSASKAGGEELCVAYHNSYNVPISIIHVSNTFGPRSQSNRFPVIAIKKLLANEPLDIHVGHNGYISGRKWLYAPDVADHTRFILNNQKTSCEKWNSTGYEFIDNLSFAQRIADILNVRPIFNHVVDNRPGHELHLSMSPSKLFDHGWIPSTNLFDQLQTTVSWYVKNKDWLSRDY